MTFRACIVIPVYNHGVAASRFIPMLRQNGLPLIIIDDASNDETAEILRDLAAGDQKTTLIRHSKNEGKGAAVISGFHAAVKAGFTHAVQIDADGQHNAADIAKFLDISRASPAALVAGTPIYDETVPKGRFLARYLTHVWVWIETLSFTIRDSMCGFRVYPLALVMPILDRVTIGRRMDFDSEIIVRIYWNGASIINVPTAVTYDAAGLSNFRMWKDNALISWMHIRLVVGMLLRLPLLIARRLRTKRELPHGA